MKQTAKRTNKLKHFEKSKMIRPYPVRFRRIETTRVEDAENGS